jgi:hypothetical protein
MRSKSHVLLRYTRKCNFIYAHNTSAGFPASILTTCTNAQQHYVKFTLEQAMKTQQGLENCSTLSLTSVIDGVGGYFHAPAALPRGITRFSLYRRLGWPQGRSGRVRKISPPLVFDARAVKPVAGRYTDCSVLALT